MATTVRITETYDMKTTVGKMGLIGIHTPDMSLLSKLYPGLIKNHRFIRFKKCDVVGACASVLPADPLQVGVTAGAVAPEDMFNPILYKAVTNESFDTLVSRIYQFADMATGSMARGDIDIGALQGEDAQFATYYALLSSKNGFRKSMPQAGWKVTGLVPICHTLLSTFGNTVKPSNFLVPEADTEAEKLVPNVSEVSALGNSGTLDPNEYYGGAITFRGKTVKMPKLALHTSYEGANTTPTPVEAKTYVMALITPPARLHEFFYRMRVTWTCSFEGVIPSTEAGNFTVLKNVGASAHASNYTYENAKSELPNAREMVDADGVDVNKIMES